MRIRNLIVAVAVLFAAVLYFADEASASVKGPISAKQAGPTERGRAVGKIERALMSDKISARLSGLGYAPKEALDKIALMSDSEVVEAAERLETIESGGDVLFELLLLVALIVFIIWLLEYMRLHRYYR